MRRERRSGLSPGLMGGVIIILIGVVLLLDRTEIVHAMHLFRFWPLTLVIVGIARLLQPCGMSGRVLGGILVVFGALLQLDNLGYSAIRFEHLWPLLVIAVGLMLVGRALEARRVYGESGPSQSVSRLNDWTVFGGIERRIAAQDFEGGEVLAVFGGSKIDLTKAGMKGNQIVIDVNTIFGGAEILVPEDWTVSMQGNGIFGGFADKTRHPRPEEGGSTRLLIVRGMALFGGVEVKN